MSDREESPHAADEPGAEPAVEPRPQPPDEVVQALAAFVAELVEDGDAVASPDGETRRDAGDEPGADEPGPDASAT